VCKYSLRTSIAVVLVIAISISGSLAEKDQIPDRSSLNEPDAVDATGEPYTHEADSDCLECHSELLSNMPSVRQLRDQDCESCHSRSFIRANLTDWTHAISDAMLAGTECGNCHSVADGGKIELVDTGNDLCADCHSDSLDEFMLLSNHPLYEGLVECRDCHPVHREWRVALTCTDVEFYMPGVLQWHDPLSQNESCLACHQYLMLTDLYQSEFVIANTMNLHKVHCEQGFAACVECHRPHGSYSPSLIRSKLEDSEYLTFIGGDGWGTCSTTCHSEPHIQRRYGSDPEALSYLP